MKPEQFIREFGEKKVREVVEGAPLSATTARPSFDFKHYLYGRCENAGGSHILLSDLNRLVESLDIIRELGSLGSAKANVREMYDDSSCDYVHPEAKLYDYKHLRVGRVMRAIADYESIYVTERQS